MKEPARHARFRAWVLIAVGVGCILLGGTFFAANHTGHNVMATVTHEGPCSNGTCTVHVSYYAGDNAVSAVMHGVPRGEVYGFPWPRLNITYFTGSETDPTTNDMPDAIWIVSWAVGLACVGYGVWLLRRTGHQLKLTEAAVVTGMTPEHEAPYALHGNVRRGELSAAMQLEDDRLNPASEQGEDRPGAAELAAARLAGEREHPASAAWPVARPSSQAWPMTGDEVRDTTFMIARNGYDVAQVDGLLRRVAAEIDADRPVEPLIKNATFRTASWARGYDVLAVDWFFEQLPLDRDLAGMNQDPWRGLAITAQLTRSEVDNLAGTHTWLAQQALWRYYSGECWKTWGQFDELPGVPLRWEWTGTVRQELRTKEKQTIACRRSGLRLAYSAGGRRFEWMDKKKLVDEAKNPILYTVGKHYNHFAGGSIEFPDQGWLRFPVRGTKRANAVMTAVDEAGNRVARYRFPNSPLVRDPVEIIVHPDWELTDQRALAIAVSARWLRSYFSEPGGG